MISRIFHVIDTATSEYFLVTTFEEVDQIICKEIGIAPGFTIINRLRGRVVDSCAGYRFDPDSYESMESQSVKFSRDGTADTFGLLISEAENIKKLPMIIDVKQVREFRIMVSREGFVDEEIMETINGYGADQLVKCLYSTDFGHHFSLIDISQNKVVYDLSGSFGLKYIMPKYLWIPVQEGEISYLNKLDIYPFRKVFIKPE